MNDFQNIQDSTGQASRQAREVSSGFWMLSLISIVFVPALLIALYEYLASATWNGAGEGPQRIIIDPTLLAVTISPALMLLAYGILLVQFFRYLKVHRNDNSKRVAAIVVMILATIVAGVVVFWKGIAA